MRHKLSVVSLFSGCGGLDLGFELEGFNTVYAADNEPAAVKVYGHNLTTNVFLRDVLSEEFHHDIKNVGAADVVLGGFPCQGFSKAGPKRYEDRRNILYLEMLASVSRLKPKVFIAENVDGLGQNFGGAYLKTITDDFSRVGYRVEPRIVDAVAYGVPQHRRRIIFVGVRVDQGIFFWPEPTHELPRRNGERKIESNSQDLFSALMPERRNRALTIRDAIADMPPLESMPDHSIVASWPDSYAHIIAAIGPKQKLCNVRHASSSVYTWNIPEAFGHVTSREREILEVISKHRRHKKYGNIPNGNPLPMDEISRLMNRSIDPRHIERLLQKGYLKIVDGKYDLKGAMFCSGLFKRPSWDEPSPTVLTNFHSPRYFLHPSQNRPFSLRECARLQGFPDTFEFSAAGVPLEDGYKLVGNAVPPPLSRALARSVAALLARAEDSRRAA
jgi:DNA (cytosine-5)-methyltransferase 1